MRDIILNVRTPKYIISMKKSSFIIAAAGCFAAFTLSGCSSSLDYNAYISEKRSEIYIYKDDSTEFKIYCTQREQPYNADGICGNMCEVREIFAEFADTPSSVAVNIGGYSGEMNYQAVGGRFTASYSAAAINADGVDVLLTVDGEERAFKALSVADKSVISCETALRCVIEHDGDLFANLTEKKDFKGEIHVRLLYDEGCYYYVGVCDRNKNTTAYLVDGGNGKIIAGKKFTA